MYPLLEKSSDFNFKLKHLEFGIYFKTFNRIEEYKNSWFMFAKQSMKAFTDIINIIFITKKSFMENNNNMTASPA